MIKVKNFYKNRRGFTLAEILIVVGIIALLSSLLIPNLLRARVNANDARAQSTLKAISTALENYAIYNNLYPLDMNNLLADTPPYLNEDFFTGTHGGFTYASVLTAGIVYEVTAHPQGPNHGSASYTITTGAVLVKN